MGEKTKKEVLTRGGKLLSAYVSQTNFVQGLDSFHIDMDTFNAAKMSEDLFPVVPYERWSRNGESIDISVGYRNAPYVNRLTQERALCDEAEKWVKRQSVSESITVFVYNMHTAFMQAACRVKKIHPGAQLILIIPDLPQFMDYKMGRVKKVLKDLDWQRIKGCMKHFDKYVLYARPMARFLKLKKGTWTVIEGSFDPNIVGTPLKETDGKISIMYSGILDLRYGIPELLDAMNLLDDKYELWITGTGNAEELIMQRADSDARIKYFGYFPSRQDLLDKQASATMLISPRKKTEMGSNYCFPSKIFEYMVSGRPVISCYLGGIPKEYHKYLFELKDVTPEEIARMVQKIAGMDRAERDKIGSEGKEFILSQKNKFKQAEKLLKFANNIGDI